MKSLLKLFFVSLVVLIGFSFFEGVSAQNLTVILTRHAEKAADDPRDPNLSEIGKAHAEALKNLFDNQSIDRFFSTPYKRTIQTIEPLAKSNSKEIANYSPAQQALFVEELKKLSNETVLVSGHSNTIPDLLNLLIGSQTYKQIDDARYGDVWIVTIVDSNIKVIQLKY